MANAVADSKGKLTMYSLPVLPFLPVENRVFVLGHHLFFPRHLSVPSLNGLVGSTEIALQCCRDCIDDPIDCAETLSLACLLVTGKPPWGFPTGCRLAMGFVQLDDRRRAAEMRSRLYHRRPPKRGDVGLNMSANLVNVKESRVCLKVVVVVVVVEGIRRS